MNIELYPVQKEFIRTHELQSVIMGPIGSGKSVSSIIKLFWYAQCMCKCRDGKRRSRWIIIRNTNKQLKDTTLTTFLQWFGDYGTMKYTEMKFIMDKIPGVIAEFNFVALDTAADVGKLLSLECTGMYFNELSEINKDVYETAIERIGRYPSLIADGTKSYFDLEKAKEYGIIFRNPELDKINAKCIIADTNPPAIGSHYYKLFEGLLFDDETGKNNNPPYFKVFKQPSGMSEFAENKKFLDEGYYEDIIANSTQEKIDNKVHAKYSLGESGLSVYGKYFSYKENVQVNTFSKYKKETKLIIGIDFGLTPACTIGQYIDGVYYIYEELYTTINKKRGLTEFLQDEVFPALTKYKYHKLNNHDILVVGDPAGNQRNQLTGLNLFQELKKSGFNLRIDTYDNTVAPRLESVKLLLREPVTNKALLVIDEKCKFINDGFMGLYMYEKDRSRSGDGGFKDIALKNIYSHIHDSIQYSCRHVIKYKGRFLDNNYNKTYYNENAPADTKMGY